jgi:rRNA maturation RNase YbeY
MTHTIVVLDPSKSLRSAEFLKRVLTAMLESEDQPPSTLELLIADDEEIRLLNATFRGVDSPTDVLSFPHGCGPDPEGPTLGEIAVCLPIAERQATMRGVSLESELACLAVHGGLHLLGYDDATESDRQVMIQKMNDIVRSCGHDTREDWGSIYS